MGSTTHNGVVITWFGHASLRLTDDDKTIYIDPYEEAVDASPLDADLIICTHSHFDHFDPDIINELAKKDTVVLAHKGCDIGQLTCETRLMEPEDREEAQGVTVRSVQAYNDHRFRNPGEPFHPRGEGMGVIVELDDTVVYHTGDTDYIEEMHELEDEEIDVGFFPIGGTFTMDVEEAAEAASTVEPQTIIPIHYNLVDRTEADPTEFKQRVEKKAKSIVQVLEPEA